MIILALLLFMVVSWFALWVFATRRAARSFGRPTEEAARVEMDKAKHQAQEVLHAPDDDIARRIAEMRAIGRGDKEP